MTTQLGSNASWDHSKAAAVPPSPVHSEIELELHLCSKDLCCLLPTEPTVRLKLDVAQLRHTQQLWCESSYFRNVQVAIDQPQEIDLLRPGVRKQLLSEKPPASF